MTNVRGLIADATRNLEAGSCIRCHRMHEFHIQRFPPLEASPTHFLSLVNFLSPLY
jgi:cytochrome c553